MLGQSLWKTRPALWSFSKFSPIARKENKILHSRIEAMHIQFAKKDRGSALAELVTVSGIGNNWCESFSMYPRTYDLIHANGVFSLYQDKIGSNGLENSKALLCHS
ncbi:probable methyltransferase PMT2 [Gossypium raimondii]|uniref:probable methyltransferase PMT2 n=1 Tax=Gossypium raimondii TaxID=29730 RepID=UPI00227C7AC8|nr:probable methyltransferase PMT2 [Gossypium raimondii]